jgi:hypothetical protein
MAPSRHGVDGGKKGSDKAVKQSSSTGNRTLSTAMSVRNLVQLSRALGSKAILDGRRSRLPSRRGTRESLPSPSKVMSLLSLAVVPEERRGFRQRFQRAKKDGGECVLVSEFLGCRTPIHMVSSANRC